MCYWNLLLIGSDLIIITFKKIPHWVIFTIIFFWGDYWYIHHWLRDALKRRGNCDNCSQFLRAYCVLGIVHASHAVSFPWLQPSSSLWGGRHYCPRFTHSDSSSDGSHFSVACSESQRPLCLYLPTLTPYTDLTII